MYLNTERFDDAIAFYQAEVLKRNPKDAKAMQSLARCSISRRATSTTASKWLKERLNVVGTNEERAEVYYLIGVQAWDRSYNFPDVDPVVRGHLVDEGMVALNKAVEMKPGYFEAISYINLLYREKAKMEMDPAKKQEYTDPRTSTSSRRWICGRRRRKRRRRRPPRPHRNRDHRAGVSLGRGDRPCLRTR